MRGLQLQDCLNTGFRANKELEGHFLDIIENMVSQLLRVEMR